MDVKKIENAVLSILEAIGADPKNEDLKETPKRVARAYQEMFKGYEIEKNKSYNIKMFEGAGGDLVTIENISFYSVCSHHLLPFFGTMDITYQPHNGKVVGLSKIPRMVEDCSAKLHMQEKLGQEIAEKLCLHIEAEWVEVKITARHLCMEMRGAKNTNSITKTTTRYKNQSLGKK